MSIDGGQFEALINNQKKKWVLFPCELIEDSYLDKIHFFGCTACHIRESNFKKTEYYSEV